MATICSSETFAKWHAIFLSVRKTVFKYPWIFQVKGANQNVRKLLSTDLVNTKRHYYLSWQKAMGIIVNYCLIDNIDEEEKMIDKV